MILPALLLTLDEYSSWRVGKVVPMIRSAVRTTLRSLLRSDLVAELKQTVIDVQRTDVWVCVCVCILVKSYFFICVLWFSLSTGSCDTKTNSLYVQTYLAIKLFLVL